MVMMKTSLTGVMLIASLLLMGGGRQVRGQVEAMQGGRWPRPKAEGGHLMLERNVALMQAMGGGQYLPPAGYDGVLPGQINLNADIVDKYVREFQETPVTEPVVIAEKNDHAIRQNDMNADFFYLSEGHHRFIAALKAGRPIVFPGGAGKLDGSLRSDILRRFGITGAGLRDPASRSSWEKVRVSRQMMDPFGGVAASVLPPPRASPPAPPPKGSAGPARSGPKGGSAYLSTYGSERTPAAGGSAAAPATAVSPPASDGDKKEKPNTTSKEARLAEYKKGLKKVYFPAFGITIYYPPHREVPKKYQRLRGKKHSEH